MADRSDAFLREVDEDLKRDQILKIWERYGIAIIAVAGVSLAGVGGYKYWQQHRISVTQAAGQQFDTAVRLAGDGKTAEALKAFGAMAASAPDGYRALAGK